MSSYDNNLLSSTQQNEVPCQHFEVARFTRGKIRKWEKRKDYASYHTAPTFSAKKITTIQKQMFCSNTFVMGSCRIFACSIGSMQPGRQKIKTCPQSIASVEFLQLEKPNMFVSQNQITYQTSEIISKHLSFQYCFLPPSLAQPHTPAHRHSQMSEPTCQLQLGKEFCIRMLSSAPPCPQGQLQTN